MEKETYYSSWPGFPMVSKSMSIPVHLKKNPDNVNKSVFNKRNKIPTFYFFGGAGEWKFTCKQISATKRVFFLIAHSYFLSD